MVISHGYETSTSGLRTLGVEEYSQLDHEGGTPATAQPSIKAGRLGNCELRPSTWGQANPSGTDPNAAAAGPTSGTSLRFYRLHHLERVRVLSVLRSHTKVETQTEDEVILREGPRVLGRGEGNLNTTPRSLDRGARPSVLKSPLGLAEGYTPSPPGEGTWASLSLSFRDNSHTSMMSHLSFRKSNIRLTPVSLLMSLSFAASLITMA
ncbi:hypothetical protein Cgig2_027185 [Carnegiea gigantea]|uniref:Uncharacterized protein n=1 Tax=Carnegiea gigantea TaxID=171969 RepID=A0A9Q1KTA3_9CARY|nr:hypothetical protein Cgig2_027185 [Carnegiea gigantea]